MSAATRRPNQVLIVEDEAHIADGISENLQSEGYITAIARDGKEGLEHAAVGSYDLIILDVMMPKMDGLAVCRALRDRGIQVPVLFLTVKAAPDDRICGLEAGADDYLAKPFHLKELLLRVAAILKRSAWYNTSVSDLSFGRNYVNFHTYSGHSWDGKTHELTHKEAMILKLMSEHEGEIVTREEILDRVWGSGSFPSTRTIDNFIARLRKRFEQTPEQPVHFLTVRSAGYRFVVHPEA